MAMRARRARRDRLDPRTSSKWSGARSLATRRPPRWAGQSPRTPAPRVRQRPCTRMHGNAGSRPAANATG